MPPRKGTRARHRDRDAKLKLQGLLFAHPKESSLQGLFPCDFSERQRRNKLDKTRQDKKVLFKLFPLGSTGAFLKICSNAK